MPELVIKVVGDTSGLDRSFQRASRSARGFDNSIRNSTRGVVAATASFTGLRRAMLSTSAAFIGGVGFVSVLKSSVDAASNLAEQTTKSTVVFDDSARAVQDWAKTSATAMGLAQDEALETASAFGALLRPLGLTGAAAAEQSKKLSQLGADLASFSNTSVPDALQAIRSGLVGEAEPLRRYGVLLSEARVAQEAMAQTGKTTATSLTGQEKVLARLAIIFRDTNQAQGDFARTSDGLANQQRILSANLRNLQIILGTALIPSIQKVVSGLNDWLGKTENQERVQKTLNTTVSTSVTVIGGLIAVMGKFEDATDWLRGKDPFGGKSLLEIIHETPVLSQALDGAAESIRGVAAAFAGGSLQAEIFEAKLRAIIGAAQDVASAMNQVENIRIKTPTFQSPTAADRLPDIVSGASQGQRPLSRPLTENERLLIQLAGDPDNVRLLQEQRARFQKALDFATKMLEERRGNTAKFAQHATRLSAQIESIDARLAGIAADRVAAAEAAARAAQDARDKVIAAQEKRRQAVIDMIGEGAHGAAQIANALDKARALLPKLPSVSGTGKLTPEAVAARQFRELGLGPTGEELAPTLKGLRAQAGRIGDAIKGTFLDKPKTRSVMASIRKVISGQLGNVRDDVRKTVKGILDDLDRQLKDHAAVGPETAFRTTNVRKILAAAGLSPEDVKRASFALSQRGPGGTIPRNGMGAFGMALAGGGGGDIVVQTKVDLDGRQVALSTTRHQQKARRRNPTQKRGPHAGGPQ